MLTFFHKSTILLMYAAFFSISLLPSCRSGAPTFDEVEDSGDEVVRPGDESDFFCWNCDVVDQPTCGNFGLVQENEFSSFVVKCVPYGQIRRGCFRLTVSGTTMEPDESDERDEEAFVNPMREEENTYLFCSPDYNVSLVCQSAALMYEQEGLGRTITFCSSCRSHLCNCSSSLMQWLASSVVLSFILSSITRL